MSFKLAVSTVVGSVLATGAMAQDAFKIGGQVTSVAEVAKQDQAEFYDMERKKFELIDRIAREKYLEYFWQQEAKKAGKSIAEAQKAYEEKNIKVSEKELQETLEKFKDHPSLQKLEKKEQEKQIRDYLVERSRREIQDGIIQNGITKGDLVIMYPEPEEPIYKVTVAGDEPTRYGPNPEDIKPMGCKGDDCAITVVEYSEFQCPFCSRVVPDIKRVLTDYKGKIRWVMRDFPLSFHDRAKPAAIAAHCAGEQKKYWHMYNTLFNNQRNLADSDLRAYAEQIGLNMSQYDKCYKSPKAMEAKIDKNFQSGAALGVTGTPAFFINGRRLSGAMPYSEFKRIIDQELASRKSH
jgi:protein-disulfide isomerase